MSIRMPSLDHAIAKNSIIQIAGRLASTAIGLFALVFMTRGLGDIGYGKYTTVIAFLQFAAIMIDFGLSLTANRLLGASKNIEEDSKIMGTILTIRAVSAAILLGLTPLIAFLFFPYPQDILIGMAIATISFFAIGMTQTLMPLFQKRLALEKAMAGELVGRVVLLFGMIIAAYLHLPLIAYVILVTGASVVTYAITHIFASHMLPLHFLYDHIIAKKIFHVTWPIAISIMFNLVYLRTDLIILSWYNPHDFAEIGYYGAAYRVLDILTGIATAFMGIMLPILTAAWANKQRESFHALIQKSFNAFVLLSLPTLLVGLLLGPSLMTLIAGARFARAGEMLAVLIVAMTAVYFSTLFGHLIVVIEKQRTMILGYAFTAVVGLSLYLTMIPRYGVWGAAWSTVITELLVLCITAVLFFRTTNVHLAWQFTGKTMLASVPMALIFIAMQTAPIVLTITIGLTAYSVMLVATRAISMQFLRGFFEPRA